MKLVKLYETVVNLGLEKDPRSKKEISVELSKARKEYRKLKGADKKYFDKERLKHPYADTRMLYGDPKKEIKTIFVGIDMETPELLLADKLREKGLPIDLVMAHHPEGRALSSLAEVMHVHKNILSKLGIKDSIAGTLLDERIGEVSRSIMSVNHTRSVETARLLDIPFICVHTPADNHVTNYLQGLFDRKKPRNVGEVMNILKSIPEYKTGIARNAGPTLITGKGSNKTGRIFVDMTGGTEGSKKVFGRLSQAGVDTIIGMHFSETHYKNAKAEHINLIIAGHITSDTLGLNLLFDNLEKKEEFQIISTSGFERIKRR